MTFIQVPNTLHFGKLKHWTEITVQDLYLDCKYPLFFSLHFRVAFLLAFLVCPLATSSRRQEDSDGSQNPTKMALVFDEYMFKFFLLFIHFSPSEESDGPGADGESELPDGHHREGLLWPAVHRPQPCQPLDRTD